MFYFGFQYFIGGPLFKNAEFFVTKIHYFTLSKKFIKTPINNKPPEAANLMQKSKNKFQTTQTKS